MAELAAGPLYTAADPHGTLAHPPPRGRAGARHDLGRVAGPLLAGSAQDAGAEAGARAARRGHLMERQ
eukprot:10415483-Lingulodinium_polyedra.AAC.1